MSVAQVATPQTVPRPRSGAAATDGPPEATSEAPGSRPPPIDPAAAAHAASHPSQPPAPLHPTVGEDARLAELRSFDILDTPDEDAFDALVQLAAFLCDAPIALISLVDDQRQWYKARIGTELCGTSRSDSFCTHALAGPDLLVIPDARRDPRFATVPMVSGPPWVRFYAGAPLITPSGAVLGTLCVLDHRPRELSVLQRTQLGQLADQVMAQLLLRRQAADLRSEMSAHEETEAALRANDRLLRGVLSHPEAVVFAKDLEGRYLLCNTTGHELFGVDEGSLIGRTDADVLDAGSASVLQRTDRHVLHHGERITATESIVLAGGVRRDYQTTKFPLRDQRGNVYALAGISTDITAQLATERALRQSEHRWRQLFDASPVGLGLIDECGRWIAVNPALGTLLGRSAGDLVDRPADELVHPADRFDVDTVAALIAGTPDGAAHSEVRFRSPDGEHRWVWSTLAHTHGPDGQRWTIAHLQDITERLAAEMAARDSQADLAAVVDVVRRVQTAADAHRILVEACVELAGADTVLLLEPVADGSSLEVTSANRTGDRGRRIALTGSGTGAAPLDPRAAAFLSGESVLTRHRLPTAAASVARARRTEPSCGTAPGAGFLVPIRSQDGVSAVLAVEWAPPAPGPDDRRIHVVSMLAEQAGSALNQRSLLTELQALAHTDALTGLPNRRSWEHRLRTLLASGPAGRGVVVALIDFDRFKNYNDTRGHAAGDLLLSGFADRARSQLKGGDMLARWGGEEFALSLLDCGAADAEAVLQRVRDAMPTGQTCSVGYVVVRPGDGPEELMERVDAALYRAKNTGRDRVCRGRDSPVRG